MLERLKNSEAFARLLRQLRQPRPERSPRLWADGIWGSAAPMLCAALVEARAEDDRRAGGPIRSCEPAGPPARPTQPTRSRGELPATLLLVVAHLDQADDAVEDAELFTRHKIALLPGWASRPDYSEAGDEIAAERLALCRRLAGDGPIFADDAQGLSPFSSPSSEKGTVPLSGANEGEGPLFANDAKRGQPPILIVAPVQALMQPVPRPDVLSRSTLSLRLGQNISPDRVAAWLTDHGFVRVEMVDVPGDFAVRGGIIDIFPAGGERGRDEPGGAADDRAGGPADSQDRAGGPAGSLPVRIDLLGDQIESIRLFDLDSQRSRQSIDGFELFGGIGAAQAEQFASFLDYLPDNSLVVLNEPNEIEELGRAYLDRTDDPSGLYPVHTLLAPPRHDRFRQLLLTRFVADADAPVVDFGCQSLQRFETAPAEAVAELVRLAAEQDVVVYCERAAEQERLREMIAEQHRQTPPRLTTRIGFLHEGFRFPAGGFLLVGHHEIFQRYQTRRRVRRVQAGRPIDSFLDLAPNDYVVHVTHGIGKFVGMGQFTRQGRTEEFFTLQFADRATVHVPASQIQLVHKYIGAFRGRPKLSTLGGRAWPGKKAQVAEAVTDLAAELLATQARRRQEAGVPYPADTTMQKEFEGSFIYQETEDQLLTLRDVKKDLQSPRPMDRLLCGDVGYGKTELAIRAAFKVAEAGKQVAVLVPTTVLAEQHERTFRERLADYPVYVEAISRFRTGGQARDILSRTATGQVDVLIGTHRLLSDDVRFRDLGLLVIDEEQRFGVAHKEKLKKFRATVDVLTMTATPIPRTLHMSLLGLRDISSLATPPMDRRAIHTELVRFNPEQIRAAVLREMNRDGQTYFVHNRVHSIQAVADRLAAIVPEARIVIGHGQMHGHQLEEVMLRFVRGEADILVCTTIIESGVDIPNVNTIFIHEADRFGLAELHQLRGRVGRYKHKAYCYLILPERRPVTPTAARRLKAVEEFSELGAGFRIALRDLEIRGAGNILGPEQSGHIAAVGYEMYCQLLDTAVRRLRGQPPEPHADAQLDLGVSGHLPRDYIVSDRQRMEVYRRLASCRNDRDIEQLTGDLADAYGPPPRPVADLIEQARIRIRAAAGAIRSIVAQPPDLVFSTDDMRRTRNALANAPGLVRVIDEHTIHLRLTAAYFEPPTLLAVLRKCLREPDGRSG